MSMADDIFGLDSCGSCGFSRASHQQGATRYFCAEFVSPKPQSNPLSALTTPMIAELREIILATLDDGKRLESGKRIAWAFYPAQGDWRGPSSRADEHRLDFCDELTRRIYAAGAPAAAKKAGKQ